MDTDYKNKQLNDLKARKKDYEQYLIATDKQIAAIEQELEENTEISDMVGRHFISKSYDHVYVVLGPALHCQTKNVIKDKVNISSHSIDSRDSSLHVYKSEYNMDSDQNSVLKDIEITKEQHDNIVAMWFYRAQRADKEIIAAIANKKGKMIADATKMVKATG